MSGTMRKCTSAEKRTAKSYMGKVACVRTRGRHVQSPSQDATHEAYHLHHRRILFTRSVGDHDAHLHLGVTANPEMNEHELNGREKFLILASDGIWDYIQNDVSSSPSSSRLDAPCRIGSRQKVKTQFSLRSRHHHITRNSLRWLETLETLCWRVNTL